MIYLIAEFGFRREGYIQREWDSCHCERSEAIFLLEIKHLEIAASLAGRSRHPASRGTPGRRTGTSLYIVLAMTT